MRKHIDIQKKKKIITIAPSRMFQINCYPMKNKLQAHVIMDGIYNICHLLGDISRGFYGEYIMRGMILLTLVI